jgi:hypothetical protein
MTLLQIIEMIKARLANLSQLRETGVREGDVQKVLQAETDIFETQKTLDQLQSLSQNAPNPE